MRATLLIGLVAAAASGAALAQSVRPGKWQTISTVTAVDMPGMPPGVAAMMKKPTTTTSCVTPEQAAKDPRAMMGADKSCKVQNYSMASGRMSATLVCRQGGATTTVTSSGTYTPTAYVATSHMVMTGGSPMKITANISSKLIGPCT